MEHVSRAGSEGLVLVRMMVGVYCRSRWQMLLGRCVGMKISGILVVQAETSYAESRLFFRLIPYTPVPPTAISASGSRRLRPTVHELLTSITEGYH